MYIASGYRFWLGAGCGLERQINPSTTTTTLSLPGTESCGGVTPCLRLLDCLGQVAGLRGQRVEGTPSLGMSIFLLSPLSFLHLHYLLSLVCVFTLYLRNAMSPQPALVHTPFHTCISKGLATRASISPYSMASCAAEKEEGGVIKVGERCPLCPISSPLRGAGEGLRASDGTHAGRQKHTHAPHLFIPGGS